MRIAKLNVRLHCEQIPDVGIDSHGIHKSGEYKSQRWGLFNALLISVEYTHSLDSCCGNVSSLFHTFVLIIGLAEQEPTVGRIEKELEHIAIRTQKELVLLHKQDAEKPKDTVKWLNMRSWCSSHHHIRCPKRVFTKSRSPAKLKEYTEALSMPPDIHSDVSRLGRFLTGTSIGLVATHLCTV